MDNEFTPIGNKIINISGTKNFTRIALKYMVGFAELNPIYDDYLKNLDTYALINKLNNLSSVQIMNFIDAQKERFLICVKKKVENNHKTFNFIYNHILTIWMLDIIVCILSQLLF